jgi:GntR family transcriptional regulator/MocR family aminotransferase
MLDLAFQADRTSAEPVYRQLEAFLRELITARRLPPGERLPSSRELASALALSRNTVNQAYQALVDDGLLRSHVGRGTFVAGGDGPSPRPLLREVGAPIRRGFAWGGLFARRTREVSLPAAFQARSGEAIRFDFRGGQTDCASLPEADLKRAYSAALSHDLASLADAKDPRGWPPLREAIARSLVARGIQCDPGACCWTRATRW